MKLILALIYNIYLENQYIDYINKAILIYDRTSKHIY